jgi:hypothetical protein
MNTDTDIVAVVLFPEEYDANDIGPRLAQDASIGVW